MNEDRRDLAFLMTPPGAAAIAVVRLRGAGVARFFQDHFGRPAAPSRCVHGELRDGERVIDDPVVVVGDDGMWADVNLHGGPWVVASVLELLRREGFEVMSIPAGPLPLEAVDGATLLGREVLAYLPLARTEQGVRLLLSQEEAWRAFLAGAVTAESVDRVGDLRPMLFPPRVAIVGAPNVGKSTLANQLFARDRSITADLPGTTRDWVGEIANLDGLAVMLVDTPGVRDTADPIERAAIERSGAVVRGADVVVEVLDAMSQDAEPRFPGALVVLNKVDRRIRGDAPHDLETVATTGAGIDALRRTIRARLGFERFEFGRPMIWTDRQREVIGRARARPEVLREIIHPGAGKTPG